MERDQRKRGRAVNGAGGDRKKERRSKGKEVVVVEPVVVVAPPTEDEVDEFFAILRRMQEAVKYFKKGKLPEVAREVHDVKVSVEKRDDVVLLDLNSVPDDDGEEVCCILS